MKPKLRNSTLIFAACCLISACGPEPIQVPSATSVSAIQISKQSVDLTMEPKAVIVDKATIGRVLTIVSENNRDWSRPWDTFPTPRATAAFVDHDGHLKLVLWFGSDWIGARAEPAGSPNLLWKTEPEIRGQVRAILDISSP
jgi:hypothetical protein